MEKLVYLLWPPADTDLGTWTNTLHGALATEVLATGAQGLQVNVSDEAVAEAMLRITSFDSPVMAVVSIWVDTVAGAVREAVELLLRAASSRLAGYLVTESVPIAPPVVPRGTCAEGFTNVALLRRPAELEPAVWLDRWQNQHTRVAIDTQDTFGYVQNVVVRAITPAAPPIDGIVEEMFRIEGLHDLHAFYGSGGDEAELQRRLKLMMDSVGRFGGDQGLDLVPTSRYVLRPPAAD